MEAIILNWLLPKPNAHQTNNFVGDNLVTAESPYW
jgi:hypothetical protein